VRTHDRDSRVGPTLWGGRWEVKRLLRYDRQGMAPHVSIFPGLTIMVTVLGLNLLGDGLRDVLDPRTGLG
jgi:peptide/nickel transport system permease protein